jgi:hypothetical protein
MRIVQPIQITDSNFVSSTVLENDYPAYSNTTGYTLGQKVILTSVHKIYESLRGGSSTVSISFANPTVIGWVAHGLPSGAPVTFTTTGALPAGLTVGATYYVVNPSADTFNVAATLGGTAIATTSAGSGTHTCADSTNIGNNPLTSPTYWLDCGNTNRWCVFDNKVQSQTTATSTLSFTISAASYVDTVALLNLAGSTARVQVKHAADGVVYDQTINITTDAEPVIDWWTYFLNGFRYQKDILFTGIPLYANTTITVTVSGAGTVAVGTAVYGQAIDISCTGKGVEHGAKVGITDYSVKTTDAFGNYIITERAFAKRANYTVYIDNTDIDYVDNLLSDVRAVPTLYIGGSKYAAMIIYGYYKTWEIDISYPDVSVCTIEIDGLT